MTKRKDIGKPTYDRLMEAYKELDVSHEYWVVNYNMKMEQIDKLCVKSAEGINRINYKLAHRAAFMSHESRVELVKERDCMRDILIHFHGFVDNDFVAGHNLERDIN